MLRRTYTQRDKPPRSYRTTYGHPPAGEQTAIRETQQSRNSHLELMFFARVAERHLPTMKRRAAARAAATATAEEADPSSIGCWRPVKKPTNGKPCLGRCLRRGVPSDRRWESDASKVLSGFFEFVSAEALYCSYGKWGLSLSVPPLAAKGSALR